MDTYESMDTTVRNDSAYSLNLEDTTDDRSPQNLTYKTILKLCFRLYATYLIINSFFGLLHAWSQYRPGSRENSALYFKNNDAVIQFSESVIYIIICVLVILFTGKYVTLMVKEDREFSLNKNEAYYIIYYFLILIIAVKILNLTVYLFGYAGMLVYFGKYGDTDEWMTLLIMLGMLIIAVVVLKLAPKFSRLIAR